jgi:hypothetical protein
MEGDYEDYIATCERCQIRLPEHLGTYVAGVRGGQAWQCAVCLPITTASGRILRDEVVKRRKALRGPHDHTEGR